MALEDVIRTAVARGLTDLQLHPVPSEDRKTTYWRASAVPSTQHKVVSVSHLDPIEALTLVLQAMPKAPKRKRADTPEVVGFADIGAAAGMPPITAAVSDPMPHAVPDPEPETDEWSKFR